MNKVLILHNKKPANLLIENQSRGGVIRVKMTTTPHALATARARKLTGGAPPHPISKAGHSDPIHDFGTTHFQKKNRMFDMDQRGLGVCL